MQRGSRAIKFNNRHRHKIEPLKHLLQPTLPCPGSKEASLGFNLSTVLFGRPSEFKGSQRPERDRLAISMQSAC
jgi:hypothetical protein